MDTDIKTVEINCLYVTGYPCSHDQECVKCPTLRSYEIKTTTLPDYHNSTLKEEANA